MTADGKAAGGRRSRRPPFEPNRPQLMLLRALRRITDGPASPASAVRSATAAGIPLRVVAEAAGVSHDTVRRWSAPVCDDCGMRHEAGRCPDEPI